MIKLRLNGTTVMSLAEGTVLRDFYNETLDNGTFVIPQVDKLDVVPFDVVELSLNNGSTWRSVYAVDVIEDISSFNPEKYNYQITFSSLTLILQKTVLPNVSVTQRLRGTKIKTLDKILHYNTVYGPNKRLTSSFTKLFAVSSRLTTFTQNVDAPEFTLQTPTLFEVFNFLLSPQDAIITINSSGQLDYILLTEKKTAFQKSTFDAVTTSKIGEQYVTTLISEVQNALNENYEIFSETLWISPRKEDEYVGTMNQDFDLVWKTQHPIYKIKKVTIQAPIRHPQTGGDFTRDVFVDITDSVVEYQTYVTLRETLGNTFSSDDKKFRTYYKQGDNKLYTFFRKVQWYANENYKHILQSVLGTSFIADLQDTWIGEALEIGVDFRNIALKIEYIPLASTKLVTSTYLPAKNDVSIKNGQSTSFVDMQSFGVKSEQDVNRLSIPEITAIKRYNISDTLPILGDTIDGYVLAARELAYHDNYIVFKGSFYKDYANKTLFTGINARKRMWRIASEGEAIERSENYKVFGQFGRQQKAEFVFQTGTFSTVSSTRLFAQYLMRFIAWSITNTKVLTASPKRKILGATLTTKNANGDELVTNAYLETAMYYAGRSVLITTTAYDNAIIGNRVGDPTTFLGTAAEFRMEPVKYVNNEGEFVTYTIKYFDTINDVVDLSDIYNSTPSLSTTNAYTGQTGTQSFGLMSTYQIYENRAATKLFPIPLTSQYTIGYVFNITDVPFYKDDREKFRHTFQVEFCAEDEDIIVTSKMAEYNTILNKDAINTRLYYSTTQKYQLGDTVGKGILIEIADPSDLSLNAIGIPAATQALMPSLSTVQSWAITDIDGNIILAVNKKASETSIPTLIYLNILKMRQGI